MVSYVDVHKLVSEAWLVYEEAKNLLKEGDIRDAAAKAWLVVETMRKAIMVAAKIPYEETKKINIAIPVFSSILIGLREKDLLDKYYTLQSTLHGMSFYEGLLNEEATVIYIIEAEKWLERAEKIIGKAGRIDATGLLKLAKDRARIKSEILSKSQELQALRLQEKAIIETIKAKIS